MYMLVYVPMKDGEKAKEGEWQIGQEVITDLQGKKLSDEEIRIRNELKQLQQTTKSGLSTPGSQKTLSTPSAVDPATKTCCQHKKNIEEQKQPTPAPEEWTPGQRRPQCNCGTGCNCAFCLDHPNNQTSHFLAQQQAAYFSNPSYGQQQQILPGYRLRSKSLAWAPIHVLPSQIHRTLPKVNFKHCSQQLTLQARAVTSSHILSPDTPASFSPPLYNRCIHLWLLHLQVIHRCHRT